ncbi:hypothetical protein HPB49_008048 [Dermacentor silvarum]|uniref:Uncharacterized protein n=1 Tax=Dermacentor silvarum TaxID=543639 RepID=A0ACB8DXT2_DERSI|nr:hypothetical protein HPB49_008048 [Dermacentor silvarum]
MPPRSVLEDTFLMSTLKWADIEDLLCQEVFQYTCRDLLSLHGFLDIDGIDSGQFRTEFRFEKHDVRRLQRALRLLEVVSMAQCVNIPGVESLCLMLRRLAYRTGCGNWSRSSGGTIQ